VQRESAGAGAKRIPGRMRPRPPSRAARVASDADLMHPTYGSAIGTASRRGFLLGMAAGAASAASAASARASAVTDPRNALSPIDWGDPVSRLEAIVRMLGRSDGGIALRWTDGVLVARVDAVTTPLFRVLSQIYSRHRRRADGGWDAALFEMVYFVDLESRALLETWRNPLTGQVVPVPQTTLGPTRLTYLPSLEVTRPPMPGLDMSFDHRVLVEGVSGDDLWVTERLDSFMAPPAPGVPPFGFHEAFTFHASAAALADRSRAHVESTVQKFNVLGWRPWMAMGDRPGTTVTRGFGRVVADRAGLPVVFQQLNQLHGKAILWDLDAILEL
jgi:hypothetical protein